MGSYNNPLYKPVHTIVIAFYLINTPAHSIQSYEYRLYTRAHTIFIAFYRMYMPAHSI